MSKTLQCMGIKFQMGIHPPPTLRLEVGVFFLKTDKKSEFDREPIVEKFGNGKIGNTYVEVDKERQHMWLYIDGDLKLESDVVTGNTGHNTPTSSGVWYIYFMDTNRHLQGSYGTSFVYRWMRFTPDGQGLHDATWRSKFGGEIYKYDGSHGCVNLPKNIAFELYDNYAFNGLPVVIF